MDDHVTGGSFKPKSKPGWSWWYSPREFDPKEEPQAAKHTIFEFLDPKLPGTGASLAALKASGARVKLQHVRAHRGHDMNERADSLARLGALGAHLRDGRPLRTAAAAPRPPLPPSAPPLPTAPSLPPDHVPD